MLIDQIEQRITQAPGAYLILNDSEIDSLTPDEIASLQQQYGDSVLLQLPPRERAFFEWLRTADPGVWTDLWGEDENLLVALSYIPALQKGSTGFPICELVDNPNYFFTSKHLTPAGIEESEKILDNALSGGELSICEALLFEILLSPIDIWHFCYKYNVPLKRGKETVHHLYSLNILVHLTERDDLMRYIE